MSAITDRVNAPAMDKTVSHAASCDFGPVSVNPATDCSGIQRIAIPLNAAAIVGRAIIHQIVDSDITLLHH